MSVIHTLGAASAVLAAVASAQVGTTQLVSVDSSEAQGPLPSDSPSVSADGNLIVFDSESALVPGDGNGVSDVFLRDLATGTTIRLSETQAGVEGNGASRLAVLTPDGGLCVFASEASNLVPGDTNGVADVFVKDLATGALTRVSVATDGSEADDVSTWPEIALDGSAVVFISQATNLSIPDLNPNWDVFVHDRATKITTLVSKSSAGVQANGKSIGAAVSARGDYVAFASTADNLVPADTNNAWDVFVHEVSTGITTRASVSPSGEQGTGGAFDPTFAADGRLLAFSGEVAGLLTEQVVGFSDIFVKDLVTGELSLISKSSLGVQGDLSSGSPAMSPDGRFVVFDSRAENLVPGDGTGPGGWDVFVHDRATGATTRLSEDPAGEDPDSTSSWPSISADGRIVAFASLASDLVPLDANGNVQDVFVRERAVDPWEDLGFGLAGGLGVPVLDVQGSLAPTNSTHFQLSGAAPGAAGAHVFGLSRIDLPYGGGVLVPAPDFVVPFTTDSGGAAGLTVVWPIVIASGVEAWVQSWVIDATGPQGFAASSAFHDVTF